MNLAVQLTSLFKLRTLKGGENYAIWLSIETGKKIIRAFSREACRKIVYAS